MADNPLLEEFTLPPFSRIKPEHVVPAVDTLLQQNRDEIRQLLQSVDKPDWKNFVEPIERLDDRLNRAWSPVSHMNSVVNSDELREAYNACLPKLSEYATEMGQNERLYAAYKALAEGPARLDAALDGLDRCPMGAAAITTSGKTLMNFPTIPSMNASGRNAATVVRTAATTGSASRPASSTGMPNPSWWLGMKTRSATREAAGAGSTNPGGVSIRTRDSGASRISSLKRQVFLGSRV